MTSRPNRIRDLKIETTSPSWLKPHPSNARTHSRSQIEKMIRSIKEFGWTNPILIDDEHNVLAGHARLLAAKGMGLPSVPVIRLSDMTAAQKRAYIIADNRLAEEAAWDHGLLAMELQSLGELDPAFDVTLTGFDMGAIDVLIGEETKSSRADAADAADEQEDVSPDLPVVSRRGDVWHLGDRHRLLCADALNLEDYRLLLSDEPANMVFTDPPYNVAIDGHVCGLGAVRHTEFAMASGEMSPEEFVAFLRQAISNMAEATTEGSIHFLCMDWRHIRDLLNVGHEEYSELKNICVWNKTNGGMGSLYRSKHEFVAVFKKGTGAHVNNVELGKNGRYRTNVWDYAGVNTFGEERDNLAIHPTVKPVQMIQDAILDCSNRDDAILDPFCGSGSTLIAAERTGRRGFGIEIEPKYVDATLRRFRKLTGIDPVREADGATFSALE